MPIDPRIPLGVQPPAPIDYQAIEERRLGRQYRLSQLKAAELMQQMHEMQMQQQQREIADQQAFQDAVRRGVGGEDLMRAAPKQAMPFLKAQGELRSQDLEQQKKRLEVDHAKASQWASIAGSVNDEATFNRAIADGLRRGVLSSEDASKALMTGWNQQTAGWLKQSGAEAMTVAEQLAEKYRALKEGREAAAEGRAAATHSAALPGVQAETEAKQFGLAGQTVGTVANQEQYDAWRAGLPAEVQKRIPAMFSPAAVQVVQRMGMTPQAAAGLDQQKATAAETARHNAAAEAATIRGQNMTDARGRAALTFRQENREPSSAERRVYSFYERAADASGVLEKMQEQMASKGVVGQAWQRYAPNVMQSEDNQVYEQAQRQFTEARLRKDSGAAIAPTEYENDRKTYFPQPGDKPQVLQRKAAARRAVLEALKRESGRAAAVAGGAPVADPWAALGFEEVK